jgi:predicted TIM-barrel fold metal-dependent hydrolase
MSVLRVDLHVHLAATGAHDATISERFRRSLSFRMLSRLLALPSGSDAALTAAYTEGLLSAAAGAREADRFVVLALDRPHSEVGVPLDPDLHVGNQVVAALCARSERLLLGASVHPYRTDALPALEEAKALGAVLVKWLPNSQGIDPASRLCLPFYRRLRELNLPLLCHTGDEHTIPTRSQDLGDPRRLAPALEAGVTVIAAHAGTRGGMGRQLYLPAMVELCGRYPRLFLETSGCCTPGRYGALQTLLRLPALRDRWVFGSDYPVPVIWPLLWGRSDGELRRRAQAATNPLDARALALRAAGVPEAAFERAAQVIGLG